VDLKGGADLKAERAMAELYGCLEREQRQGGDAGRPDGAPGRGYGHYASYHALWHLREIGVVPDLRSFESPAWDAAEARLSSGARRTRVALIDTSVAHRHPNLEGAILAPLMIDFFSARFGTFPAPDDDGELLDAALATAGAKAETLEDGKVRALLERLHGHLAVEYRAAAEADWRAPGRVNPATSPIFSAHGTAMAGLIGARPRGPDEVRLVETTHVGAGDAQPSPPLPDVFGFPYAGVDPFCEIVPVSTSFEPDPEQLLLAMLYAWLIDADIIVLARDFPDPLGSPITGTPGPEPGVPPEAEREALRAAHPAALGDAELQQWAALRALTVKLSRHVPLVCAAGNGGDTTMILPAALAAADNGIIALGARAATGNRAGYSTTGRDADGAPLISLYAPSGDGERLDEEVQRLDTADPGFRPEDHSSDYIGRLGVQHPALPKGQVPEVTPSIFATQEIVTTDVPGAAGYNVSAFSQFTTPGGSILDYRSYYCRFSGTSAAAAIAAGMLSLAMSAGRVAPGDGVEAKRHLRGGDGPTKDAAASPTLSWSAAFG
jgi:hypothetical protein